MLLVLGSFVVLWNIVYMVVRDSSDEIGIEGFVTRFEIEGVRLDSGNVYVNVHRVSGDEVVKELKFVFYLDGDVVGEGSKSADIPSEMESEEYEFLGMVVDMVGVIPVFEDGSFGLEVEGVVG